MSDKPVKRKPAKPVPKKAQGRFGVEERIVIESEIQKLSNRATQGELSFEDAKKLDLLLKNKKMILDDDRDNRPEEEPEVRDVEELLSIVNGEDDSS